jgi:NAD(P)-dependent dehydrogenase (short-subunit alcohol dehydrogenase family)
LLNTIRAAGGEHQFDVWRPRQCWSSNYGAAKAGITAFSFIAARELRRHGVTVNAIAPSAQTPMTEGLRTLDEGQRERAVTRAGCRRL